MPGLPLIEGFLLGFGLLLALGPKDTFVIKSSLQGHSALMLVLVCALSDVALIVLGTMGLGVMVATNHALMVCAMVFSIAYLLYFSAQAFRSAWAGPALLPSVDLASLEANTKRQAMKTALFHSLLTPYAWLDTVLVIGAVSAAKAENAKVAFASGAMIASFLWFIFLTVGARLAAPVFQNRRAWQCLDVVVALSMFVLAAKLMSDFPWR